MIMEFFKKNKNENPEPVPSLPEPLQTDPATSELAFSGKKELLEEFNKSLIPENYAKEFWHFTSNSLSTSFLDPNDEIQNENLFWVINEMQLKQFSVEDIDPNYFQQAFQVFLHGKARLKQSMGTINARRNNLVTLFTKIINVQETRNDGVPNKRGKFR